MTTPQTVTETFPHRANDELPEFAAFRTVMWYVAAIVILPIVSLFVSKNYIFDSIFADDTVYSNIFSAICCILVLHIALGAFIYKAYSKPDKTMKTE